MFNFFRVFDNIILKYVFTLSNELMIIEKKKNVNVTARFAFDNYYKRQSSDLIISVEYV